MESIRVRSGAARNPKLIALCTNLVMCAPGVTSSYAGRVFRAAVRGLLMK